ncbi:MAG TPA: asparagine synthase (glutamine-hydrolyzing) [Pyrinomonadaceae bacterium]|jgi:asparagine synthase (glutamine-hydrolysing)
MCGIAGIVSRKGQLEQAQLKRMTDAIAHRGPDGEGAWINFSGNAALGHRRLAIIDLSESGRQPMFYANGRFSITFNGEIYNYLELRDDLEKRGFKFKSTSDTEVLLALFAEKGEKCLAELDGMFAFAIWDEQEQSLFAARDRFGEKPFYYAIYDNTFYFASEMKALWAAGVPRAVSNRMLYNYLTAGNMYNPHDLSQTFYEGIFKLKAAHYFFISPQELKIEQTCYWNLDYKTVKQNISDDEAAEEFRFLFNESVKRRLRSDVPVGSSLSGGLDSSLVVCTIDRLNAEKPVRQATFSARFPGFAKDEGKYMQAVIERTNAESHFVYPDDFGLVENLEKLFHHQEEPFGSASIYAQFCVMQLAKENNVTVLLDGQGADELLAGYHPYFEDYFRDLAVRDKKTWRQEQQAFYDTYGAKINGDGFNLKETVRRFLPAVLKDKARSVRHRLQKTNGSGFLDSGFQQEFSDFSFSFPPRPDNLPESLYRSTTGGSLEELLRYADRNSMAHSREVRLPFLYHRLAEFLFSLPSNFKIRNATTKYIMREAFKDILPAEIVNRTDKIGYEPPQKSWLANPRIVQMVDEAASLLSEASILNKDAQRFISRREAKTSIFNSYNWKMLMAANLFKR